MNYINIYLYIFYLSYYIKRCCLILKGILKFGLFTEGKECCPLSTGHLLRILHSLSTQIWPRTSEYARIHGPQGTTHVRWF